MHLAIGCKSLCENGHSEVAALLFRSCVECTVNLLYIIEVGHKIGDKSSNELAAQFGAYGDVAYSKLLTSRRDQAQSAFMRRKGFTEAEFNDFFDDKRRLRESGIGVHDCKPSSWHEKDFATRAALVRDNKSDYVDGTLADMLFSSFQSANSAVHGDALALRSHYKATGCGPLEFTISSDWSHAHSTGHMTFWAWKCLARYFNDDEWMYELLDGAFRTELRSRIDAEEMKAKRKILIPEWIKL